MGRHHFIDWGGEREGLAQVTFEQRPEYREVRMNLDKEGTARAKRPRQSISDPLHAAKSVKVVTSLKAPLCKRTEAASSSGQTSILLGSPSSYPHIHFTSANG